MEPKLCCVLNTEVKCRECNEGWCHLCWFGENDTSMVTSHTTGKSWNGGWGKCPKVNKWVGWDYNSTEALQWIHIRADQDLYDQTR